MYDKLKVLSHLIAVKDYVMTRGSISVGTFGIVRVIDSYAFECYFSGGITNHFEHY